MKLLVDTDAFCKLSASGLFFKAIDLLGADITECARLPALPYMLKKGRLRTMYGPAVCDELMPIAHSMPIVDCTNNVWLDKLTLVQSIDPGEAQLFAMGAATGFLVMTGDKRALRELKNIPDFPQLLSGRIVVLETVLIALCDLFGSDKIRHCIQGLAVWDIVARNSFSSGNTDPRDGLNSYYNDLEVEVDPLVLWNPRSQGNS